MKSISTAILSLAMDNTMLRNISSSNILSIIMSFVQQQQQEKPMSNDMNDYNSATYGSSYSDTGDLKYYNENIIM